MKRVLLVTGSSRGIGRYLAERYAKQGFQVVGCSRGPAAFKRKGYTHFTTDVADERQVNAMFLQIRKAFGRLDVVINNAALLAVNSALLTPGAAVRDVLAANVLGTFLVSREAAKIMQRHGPGGRIVNFSTVLLPLKVEGQAAYVASKAGVVGLTQALAAELAPLGITVNAVGPTPVKTDMLGAIPESAVKALVDRQLIRRLGEFRDVANAVDFFIRPESDFITGQVLYLGGA